MEQFKRVQVVMLPTNNKANALWSYKGRRLYSNQDGNLNDEDETVYYHLYFLSDDKIEEGDYVYHTDNKVVAKYLHNVAGQLYLSYIKNGRTFEYSTYRNECKKVIATTDSSLKLRNDVPNYWSDCLPQPSEQFIEKYVGRYNAGKPITDVLVEYNPAVIKEHPMESSFASLKVNPKDNTITIKKLKDSWNREEIEALMLKAYSKGYGAHAYRDNYETTFKQLIIETL